MATVEAAPTPVDAADAVAALAEPENQEDPVRNYSKYSVESAPSRRVSRDVVIGADEGSLNLHISARARIERISGKHLANPGNARGMGLYRAAYELTKCLSRSGIPTVMTNFRGNNQAAPYAQVDLCGPVPGLDLAGDFHSHWTDFANLWEDNGISTKEVLDILKIVDSTLVQAKGNAKGLKAAYEEVEAVNAIRFHERGLSMNFHMACIGGEGASCWNPLSRGPQVSTDVFFVSITPFEGGAAAFPAGADMEVDVAGCPNTVWRLQDVWSGDMRRPSKQSAA